MVPRRDIARLIEEKKWGGARVRSEDRITGELIALITAIVATLFAQTIVMEGPMTEQLSQARTQADRSKY